MNSLFAYTPAVFAAGKNYSIAVLTTAKCIFSVTVNGKTYFDHSNGVCRSESRIHRVDVPMRELDNARAYTVSLKKVFKRLPYRSVCGKEETRTFAFRPVPSAGEIRLFHIADAHGETVQTVAAAKKAGPVDALILNGDIIDSSLVEKSFAQIYAICDGVTKGEIPVINSRGNHDLRGKAAEIMEKYIPVVNGNTYFTTRLGALWCLLLDCAEDKPDSHVEYGGVNCCHAFREEETRWLESLCGGTPEWNADGITCRLVISHKPICTVDHPPFDIEQDIFGKWARLLRETVKPDLLLHGHTHRNCVSEPGSEYDHLGQPCTAVVGSEPHRSEGYFIGCLLTVKDGTVTPEFIAGK